MSNIQYGYWRTDKPAEPGFSQELISAYSDPKKLDSLDTWPVAPDTGRELKTLTEAVTNLASRLPDHPWMGTKVKTGTAPDGKPTYGYEWMTVKECVDIAKLFGAGLVAKQLIPAVEGEGR